MQQAAECRQLQQEVQLSDKFLCEVNELQKLTAIKSFIKGELEGWGKVERFLFPLIIAALCAVSFMINDSKIALISAVCGICYTILAGKGKISCYFIGICGTVCYVWIAYRNTLYGNLLLYALYYLPMQVAGIFKWKKHLKKDKQEIEKTTLSRKERVLYFSAACLICIAVWAGLHRLGSAAPFADAFSVVFSVLGMLLTVKRCYEQWIVWLFVNAVSLYMWILAYLNGSNCFATIVMWSVYLCLAVYFMSVWKREIK